MPRQQAPHGKRTAARLAALGAACILAACATSAVLTPPKLAQPLVIHYPDMSQDLGEEGVVRVRLRYNIHGVVQEARIVQSSGSKRLDATALAAARKARLLPGTRNGVPQGGVVVLPVRFVLQDKIE